MKKIAYRNNMPDSMVPGLRILKLVEGTNDEKEKKEILFELFS